MRSSYVRAGEVKDLSGQTIGRLTFVDTAIVKNYDSFEHIYRYPETKIFR